MTGNKSGIKFAPAYVSFGVFIKIIETFSSTTIPSGPIDRRVLNDLSGGDYSALISGLRFLELVDDERKATAEYRELVHAWTDRPKFKERLAKIISEKYTPILGSLNLKHGTSAELEKAFKDYGVSAGQMLTKTIRFFLKVATEAGFQLSPYMTARKPRTPGAGTKNNNYGRKGSVGAKHGRDEMQNDEPEETPGGFERLPLPGMPNSFIQYPVNLTEAHCQILEAMVGVLRTSVKARTGEKERRP
jgi:hypothetical protein